MHNFKKLRCRANANGLTSSSKLSVSCVVTLQTLPEKWLKEIKTLWMDDGA